MSKSAAVVVERPGQVAYRHVQLPRLGPRDVLIRRTHSGVSNGTDRWVCSGRFTWDDVTAPLVPGYQSVGVVEEVGSQVHGLTAGQVVVSTRSRHFADVASGWGGHAAAAVVPADQVFDATGVPPMRAALIVAAQVGYNAASRLAHEPRGSLAVFGDGIIGASAALAASLMGWSVIVVGRSDHRAEQLNAVGLPTLRDGARIVESLRERGVTAVIDTVQNTAAFDAFVEVLPVAGQIVYSGHSPDGVTAWANMARLQQRQLTTHFVSGWDGERVRTVLRLMAAGEMACDRLVDEIATSPAQAERLMTTVTLSKTGGVAALIDWSNLS